jgi:hypothetical protein
MSRIRRSIGAGVVAAALCLWAGGAAAQQIDLLGVVVITDGTQKLKLKGESGVCEAFSMVTVEFLAAKPGKVKATDQDGKTYRGRYDQSGDRGRAIDVKLNKKSRKRLRKAIEGYAEDCLGASNVDISSMDIRKAKGKVNDTLDAMVVRIKVVAEGKADGDRGVAVYTIRTDGALSLP